VITAKTKAGQDTASDVARLGGLVEVSEDQKAIRYFKSMEDGDPDALALWRRFRNLSIERYQQTYQRLNIAFDEYAGEATVPAEDIKAVSKELAEKGISEDSEGAVIVDFEKHGAKKLGKAILLRKDGTPLYLTRDIAEIRRRWNKHHFDKMIYVVASAQDLHLAQFFKVTEVSGHSEISEKCEHINFGLVKGMSTRKGEVKFLDDILADVADKMHEVMKKNEKKYEQVEKPEQTADILGITAVMVQDMKGKRINGYTFDINVSSFNAGSGSVAAMLTRTGNDLVRRRYWPIPSVRTHPTFVDPEEVDALGARVIGAGDGRLVPAHRSTRD
jgi:arginyl-tRNA synthetase